MMKSIVVSNSNGVNSNLLGLFLLVLRKFVSNSNGVNSNTWVRSLSCSGVIVSNSNGVNSNHIRNRRNFTIL